jgi:uncharacterized protein (DUF697 family)
MADTMDEIFPETLATSPAVSDADLQKRAGADGIVKNGVIAAMAVGLVPIPVIGVVGLVAANLTMLQALSHHYGVPFQRDVAKSAVVSLVGGLAPVGLGVGFSEALKLIPGFGSLAGAAGTSVLAGAVTYAVGRAFIQHFEEGETFLSLDLARLRKVVRFEFKRGRKVAETLATSPQEA